MNHIQHNWKKVTKHNKSRHDFRYLQDRTPLQTSLIVKLLEKKKVTSESKYRFIGVMISP